MTTQAQWSELCKAFTLEHAGRPKAGKSITEAGPGDIEIVDGGLTTLFQADVKEFAKNAQEWAKRHGLEGKEAMYFGIERAVDAVGAFAFGQVSTDHGLDSAFAMKQMSDMLTSRIEDMAKAMTMECLLSVARRKGGKI